MNVAIVNSQEELAKCLRVRKDVFVQEQGVAEELEVDEYDISANAAVHFLLRDENGTELGASRLKTYEPGSAKLQRIAILKSFRGKGYGRLLVEAMERQAVQLGYTFAVLDAQVQASAFYAKMGYAVISTEPFLDAGIEHVRMKKPLQLPVSAD
ncbi:GNAT family N-acetyltransferase [Paenibacillus koleovorans]|uniref:GNAT family N-acetyltransferase n=1 Tax=Paenibacillus koleovorans TaxID=121608 RepID=UPI000FD719FD|nr:GNAT family N-acetyltransferase [Paenibacillus koleovorans]